MSSLKREGKTGLEVDTISVCDEVSGIIIRIGLNERYKEIEITWRVVDLPASDASTK